MAVLFGDWPLLPCSSGALPPKLQWKEAPWPHPIVHQSGNDDGVWVGIHHRKLVP